MTNQEAIDLIHCCLHINNEKILTARDMAIQALEKQIPKKITEIHCDEYYCPNCGSENNCDQYVVSDKYCPKCGQALYFGLEEK